MKTKLYSIRDRKAGTYGTPFASFNDDTAKRDFSDFVVRFRINISLKISSFIISVSLKRILEKFLSKTINLFSLYSLE